MAKRSRRLRKAEEATLCYCEYPDDYYCCSNNCFEHFSANRVAQGRQTLLQFEDQSRFLHERVKVRSLVVVKRRSVYMFSSSDDESDAAPEGLPDIGGSHHRSSFFVDSEESLAW
jgi:hypothetical protein